MAGRRLRREQQVERNREQLLGAARRVFLERGFHGASLEAIAEAAGFSKGVVYSQFESKADLFLALLEERIEERAAENERIAAGSSGPAALATLLAAGERSFATDPAWSLLLTEFRVHAARDPVLRERYARLHARTVGHLAGTLARISEDGRGPGGESPETMALFVLALGAGFALEGVGARDGLPGETLRVMTLRALARRPDAPARSASATPVRRTATPRRRRQAGRST